MQDKLKELQLEENDLKKLQSGAGAKVSKKATDPMRRQRILENRLDKAMLKFNEAMSIKKTYEIILKRLHEERIGYDKQLASLEQAIKAKECDLQELLLLSHDAQHAKDLAS